MKRELYNDGQAFKLTCRDESGVIVTILADNYYGYCKKEVKTQISYAANLYGLCEEEHAGGALVFPSYDLGEDFSGDLHVKPWAIPFRKSAPSCPTPSNPSPKAAARTGISPTSSMSREMPASTCTSSG